MGSVLIWKSRFGGIGLDIHRLTYWIEASMSMIVGSRSLRLRESLMPMWWRMAMEAAIPRAAGSRKTCSGTGDTSLREAAAIPIIPSVLDAMYVIAYDLGRLAVEALKTPPTALTSRVYICRLSELSGVA